MSFIVFLFSPSINHYVYQIYVDNVFERKALVALAQKAGLMTMSKLANNYVPRYQKIYLRAGVTKCKGTNKSQGLKHCLLRKILWKTPSWKTFGCIVKGVDYPRRDHNKLHATSTLDVYNGFSN